VILYLIIVYKYLRLNLPGGAYLRDRELYQFLYNYQTVATLRCLFHCDSQTHPIQF